MDVVPVEIILRLDGVNIVGIAEDFVKGQPPLDSFMVTDPIVDHPSFVVITLAASASVILPGKSPESTLLGNAFFI